MADLPTSNLPAGRIRTIIADDEPLGQRRIATLLADVPDVEVVGICANGAETVASVRALAPDLLFLDIQMPLLDGFAVLEALDPAHMPAVIFVTAYDAYALQAFEVHALDYLLKPFDRARFHAALEQARRWLHHRTLDAVHNRVQALLAARHTAQDAPPTWPARLAIRESGRVYFLAVDDIDWIEAAGNYLCLHTGLRTHLLRETMQHLAERLSPNQFLRVHRSAMVNVARIASAGMHQNQGSYKLTLIDGTQIAVSRSYRQAVRAQLEHVAQSG